MNECIKEIIKYIILFVILGVILYRFIIFQSNNYKDNNRIIEPNVELQKHNDSLRIKVDNLDSIKNAKVIEVKALDNDSTVKLFYKLIK
jgi:hypothetical protein